MGNKEEKLFIREFFRKAGKAIYDYNMIEEGEKILVGVSAVSYTHLTLPTTSRV